MYLQLKELEYGIDISINGISRDIRFFLIGSVFDKPARADVLNMIGSNGFHGCLKSYQPGQTYQTQSN